MISTLFSLLLALIQLYIWVLIIACVFSMLGAFNVLDTRNRAVWMIGDFLNRVTEPVLVPVRRLLPRFGAVDLSPLIVLLLLQYLVVPLLLKLEASLLDGQWQRMML